MRTIILMSLFVGLIQTSYVQVKNYKNQLNRKTKSEIYINKLTIEKKAFPSFSTPKYEQKVPNLEWVDTSKNKTNRPSYKQHGGRPN